MAGPGPGVQDGPARNPEAQERGEVQDGEAVRNPEVPRRGTVQRGGPPGDPQARGWEVRVSMSSQAEKAELFRSLHRGGRILVLPNAWDVPSARVFEDSGFKAVATSSAGMMVSLGYQDGEAIPRREFMQGVKRIAGALGVPLSADVVAGFGGGPAGVERTVKEVVKAGAVGINIEDFVHLTKTLMPL